MSKEKIKALADLKPDTRNARKHNPRNIDMIQDAIQEVGVSRSGVIDEDGNILAGNGTYEALSAAGIDKVRVIETDGKEWVVVKRKGLTDQEKAKLALYDNRTAELAGWDPLNMELIKEDWPDIFDGLFSEEELEATLGNPMAHESDALEGEDDQLEAPKAPRTNLGDVYTLGDNRLMCGDSTNSDHIKTLMAGAKAALLHADPPYGMGKEKDGVLNDNLYQEKLDKFQLEWWAAARSSLFDNASAYIWGNAPDLWRLWYTAGLGSTEEMELRNQIVWDKKSIAGMASPLLTQYPVATEHALFFQLGLQFLGNINADQFPETWEPLRSYMAGQAEAASITSKDIREICNNQMFCHWFTKSQFCLIPEKHYSKLQAARPGYFKRPWLELKAEWARVRGAPWKEKQDELGEARAYFNNSHDVMHDVWSFGRVTGEERHGHATPKPVDMMRRIMYSSLPEEGLCLEPFGGSGSTLIAAESTGRQCYTMEMDPAYCDVIVQRYHNLFPHKELFLNGEEINMKQEAVSAE